MAVKTSKSTSRELLSIGKLADRTGLSVTAIRFYEAEALVCAQRNADGQRRFPRSDIRRLSFVKICQGLGFPMAEIRQSLSELPDGRTPTKRDWEKLSHEFAKEIEVRIETLSQ